MDIKTRSFADIIGQNVKKFRTSEGLTMGKLASAGKKFLGLTWSAGSINAIECGSFKPTLDTLMALAYILPNANELLATNGKKASKPPLQIFELIKGADAFELSPSRKISSSETLEWLGGRGDFSPKFTLEHARHGDYLGTANISVPPSDGEVRIAEKAGISPEQLMSISIELWCEGFELHRDKIAGSDATPQKRGRVTRNLIAEIHEHLESTIG